VQRGADERDLTGANLTRADLGNANLTNANLSFAILIGGEPEVRQPDRADQTDTIKRKPDEA